MFKRKEDYEQLCLLLGYQFRNKRLLAQAITTKSAYHNKMQQSTIGHQEQMEFLGDSVLRLVVDQILMEEFPHAMPDELSVLRDKLVKNANLYQAAKKLGLSPYIIMDRNQAQQCENSYFSKVLADTMEALICAIYKDSNNNLNLVKEFILSNSMISNVLTAYREELAKNHQPFIEAIQKRDIKTVKQYLLQKINPNLIFSRLYDYNEYTKRVHFTALSFAINCLQQLYNNEEKTEHMMTIIELLLGHGADVNIKIKDESPLAHDLISPPPYDRQKGWGLITDRLLELFCQAGLDFTMQGESFDTVLTLAVRSKQSYKIELLIKAGADVNYPNRMEETALHIASEMGDSDLVGKLVSSHARASSYNMKNKTAFDVAKTPAIKYQLLQAELSELSQSERALPEDFDKIKNQAIQLYNAGVNDNSAQSLAKAIALFQTVLRHMQSVSATPASQLISGYFNLGSTYFQQGNHLKAKPFLERAYILCLYEIGAKEERTLKIKQRLELCTEKLGEKPTKLLTAQNRHTTFANNVPSLAKQKIEEQDSKLFKAAKLSQAEQFEALLNNGANPDACNEEGQNILSYAIQQYAAACLLYNSIADIFDYPETSINYQMKQKLEIIIQLLLQWKADVNQRDTQGQTALHRAAAIGNEYIVTQLLNAQANPTISDYKGNYPSHLAANKTTKTIILKALQAVDIKQNTPKYENIEQKRQSFTLL